MKSKILLVTVAALLTIAAQAFAQDVAAHCVIRIDDPQPEQEVGFTIYVKGAAESPPGHHLWVFLRPESHHTIGTWWPQGEDAGAHSGRWRVMARLGSPANVGEYFQVAVALFAESEHQILASFLKNAQLTGRFEPIEMPAPSCVPVLVTVRKTSHVEPGKDPCPEKSSKTSGA